MHDCKNFRRRRTIFHNDPTIQQRRRHPFNTSITERQHLFYCIPLLLAWNSKPVLCGVTVVKTDNEKCRLLAQTGGGKDLCMDHVK